MSEGDVVQFRTRLATPAEILGWVDRRRRAGVGAVGGPASGNLVVLDFETDAAFRAWCGRLTDVRA